MATHARARSAIAAAALALLSLPLVAGCLEGDPNPLKQGSSSGTITPGSSGSPAEIPTVQPSGACSQAAMLPVTLTFRNQTSRSVDLFWADYQCKELSYGTIGPGASHLQQTFVGHVWRLRDTATGALYKEFIPTTIGSIDVVIP
jgi:hypothetical protein